jgi:hypothetical protein
MILKIKEILQWAKDNDVDDLAEDVQKLLNQRVINPDDDEMKFWIRSTPNLDEYPSNFRDYEGTKQCKIVPFFNGKSFFEVMDDDKLSNELTEYLEKTHQKVKISSKNNPFISKVPHKSIQSSEGLGFDAKQGAVAVAENIVAQELFSLLGNKPKPIQEQVEDILMNSGFKFGDSDNGIIFMYKKVKGETFYAQIERDGKVNGVEVNEFLRNINQSSLSGTSKNFSGTSRMNIYSMRRGDIIQSRILGEMNVLSVTDYKILVSPYGKKIDKRDLGQDSFDAESFGAYTIWHIAFPPKVIAELKRR